MKRVGLVVLAAGRSSRFGSQNKLLADLGDTPILERSVSVFDEVAFAGRVLVVRELGEGISRIGLSHGFKLVQNLRAESGIGSSIQSGLAEFNEAAGVMIALGDMPFITPETVLHLLETFQASSGSAIIAPAYCERMGHPKIFSRAFFTELRAIHGDCGAAQVIAAHARSLTVVPVDDEGVVKDVDVPGDLAQVP